MDFIIGGLFILSLLLLVFSWKALKQIAISDNKPIKDVYLVVCMFSALIYIPAIFPYGFIFSILVMIGMASMLIDFYKKKDDSGLRKMLYENSKKSNLSKNSSSIKLKKKSKLNDLIKEKSDSYIEDTICQEDIPTVSTATSPTPSKRTINKTKPKPQFPFPDSFTDDDDPIVLRVILFDYINAKGENKSRRVKVIQAGDFYFDAIDLNIHQSRTFRYDRIDGDVIIEDTGEMIRPSRLHNYFQKNIDGL